MSDSDYGKSARRGQDRTVHLPAVIPGGLYTRKQLINNLSIGDATLGKWEAAGLRAIKDIGASATLYLADDVLEFLKSNRNEG